MKITVFNGSPRGRYSTTIQSAHYIHKYYPDAEFEIFDIGQKIKSIAKSEKQFQKIIESVTSSDAVLWCYPVYTFLVPFQLMEFIELIFERKQEAAFSGKYSSQISTSKHFHDHSAYNYIHQICEDLGMKHIHGHTADMDDLTFEHGRKNLLSFAEEFFTSIENQVPVSTKYIPVISDQRNYTPSPAAPVSKRQGHEVVLVTDCDDPNSNLGKMISMYQDALPFQLKVINLNEFDFSGGCLGCFNCAIEGNCIYKDGFDQFHAENILHAECVIYAAEVKRHWFNSIWKCFDDRQFYNGHRTTMMGNSVGYLLSGPLRQEHNMRQVLEARSEVAHLFLIDIITDEDHSQEIDALIKNMAEKTVWALENKPVRPMNFLGVGGLKVFRDLIYVMRGLMKEDHRFYKKQGIYKDFPQRQVKRILQMQLIGLLLGSEKTRKQGSTAMRDNILKQYQDVIAKY